MMNISKPSTLALVLVGARHHETVQASFSEFVTQRGHAGGRITGERATLGGHLVAQGVQCARQRGGRSRAYQAMPAVAVESGGRRQDAGDHVAQLGHRKRDAVGLQQRRERIVTRALPGRIG